MKLVGYKYLIANLKYNFQDINKFEGKISIVQDSGPPEEFALDLDNTMWANTVVASGEALGFVIYTGPETRYKLTHTLKNLKTTYIKCL